MISIEKKFAQFIAHARGGLNSLRRHVSACSLVTIAAIGASLIGFHMWSMVRLSRQVMVDAESAANFEISGRFAERLRILGERVNQSEVEQKLDELAALNPAVRLYIVDHRGIVRESPHRYGRVVLPFVDLKPMQQALLQRDIKRAVLGDDPHAIMSLNPISVAPLRFRGAPAYVYVVLAPVQSLAQTYNLFGLKLGLFSLVLLGIGGALILLPVLAGIYAHCRSIHTHLAAVSHDLRSPLTAIQGYLETIIDRGEGLSNAEKQRFMSVALKSAHSATRLVNDVHHLSKLDATEVEIEREPLSATDLVMDVVMAVKPACDEKKITIEADLAPALPLCIGNVQLLERLIRNVVENAIRYTPPHGMIRVHVAHDSRGARVTVLDSGVGIPHSELDRVKNPFFRGKAAETSLGGSGLGLSISSKIARLHGSELKVLSRQSEGTAVVFTIPAFAGQYRSARNVA